MKQEVKILKVEELHLWTENPRDPIQTKATDYEIITRAIQNDGHRWNLSKLLKKMGAHYDLSELPTVVKVDGKYVVFDGNRRIAILKYLQNKDLYALLGGGIFLKEEPIELRELFEIPCNLCDKETALVNIERKHSTNGSWGIIEREYFLYNHKQQEKSLFIKIDEQTNIIHDNPKKLNKLFVKDEILTEKNLNKIGFGLDDNGEIVSAYDTDTENKILDNIVELIEKEEISTRKNRGLLKEPLIKYDQELAGKIKGFSADSGSKHKLERIRNKIPRKTPIRKPKQILFGETLELKKE